MPQKLWLGPTSDCIAPWSSILSPFLHLPVATSVTPPTSIPSSHKQGQIVFIGITVLRNWHYNVVSKTAACTAGIPHRHQFMPELFHILLMVRREPKWLGFLQSVGGLERSSCSRLQSHPALTAASMWGMN